MTTYKTFADFEPGFGHTIIVPCTTLEECAEYVPQDFLPVLIRQIEYNFLNSYPETIGAMWKRHGYQLALYHKLLRQRFPLNSPPSTLNRVRQTLTKKDTGLPIWWGDPEIHNSHKEYLNHYDKKCLLFPEKYYYSRTPFPRY